jgi:hypothetical protein
MCMCLQYFYGSDTPEPGGHLGRLCFTATMDKGSCSPGWCHSGHTNPTTHPSRITHRGRRGGVRSISVAASAARRNLAGSNESEVNGRTAKNEPPLMAAV